MRHPLLAAATLIPAFLLSGCLMIDFGPSERYRADFHYVYDLQPGGRLNLENFNGPVEIAGWEQNKVEITGARFASTREGLNNVRIDVQHAPDSVNIRTEGPSMSVGHLGASYTIRLPRAAIVDHIRTSNGSIHVQDLDSGAHLKSTNGAIRVENLTGSVSAQTSNAPIDLRAITGGAIVRTTNGRIHAEEIGGECEATTSNGGITIRLNRAPEFPVKASTTNGPIDLTLAQTPRSGIRAETTNGAITLHLPADASARIEATTSNSSIRSDFEASERAPESSGNRNRFNGTIGAGGPLIDLSTHNGHISVLKL